MNQLPPISNTHRTYPTNFQFADLDFWVDAARGTDEYQIRLDLANQIIQTHAHKFTGFLLEGGNLTSLPRAIGYLPYLEELTISDNFLITSLPPEIEHLKSLKTLVLTNLGITSLPPEIGRCSDLRNLRIANTELGLIPDEIGNLRQLEHFCLRGNTQLFNLPPSIGRLQNLRGLNLQNCSISYLSKELFSLPKLTYLDLQGCPFSAHALGRLQAYIHPSCTIVYSQENLRDDTMIERPFEELIETLYDLVGRKESISFKILSGHPDFESLRKFLNKFFHTENFLQYDYRNEAKAAKLLEYIKEAEENNNYRSSFFACLKSVDSLKDDQIPIVLLLLGMEKKLAHADLSDLQTLHKLLLGVWITRSILRIVRDRFNDLTIYDSVQIYLGYLAKLKSWHNLPLDEEDLRLFSKAPISAVHLHTASKEIDRVEANLTKQVEFLTSHNLWLEALKHSRPLVYAEKCGDQKALAEWTREIIERFIPVPR